MIFALIGFGFSCFIFGWLSSSLAAELDAMLRVHDDLQERS